MASQGVVYAGTFDPITNGHLDIIERAARLFSPVIVGVAEVTGKSTLFLPEERVAMIRESVRDISGEIRVEQFSGLLVSYVRACGCTTIVRGLRAVSDYEYEAQLAIVNRDLDEEIETVFLMTSRKSSFISSSIVRQISLAGGDVSKLVPPAAAAALHGKHAGK